MHPAGNSGTVEVLAMAGTFGAVLSGTQALVLEHSELWHLQWSGQVLCDHLYGSLALALISHAFPVQPKLHAAWYGIRTWSVVSLRLLALLGKFSEAESCLLTRPADTLCTAAGGGPHAGLWSGSVCVCMPGAAGAHVEWVCSFQSVSADLRPVGRPGPHSLLW